MTRLFAYILLLSFFLLAACNGEKEFMTPKTGEVVLDINAEEFSLNGKVLGKTTTDISASDDLLIESLDKELKNINTALKFNPTSVELWRQKQQVLSQPVCFL